MEENMENKRKYWFFGSKLNTALLLVLIVLMVVALRWMYQNKEVYMPNVNVEQTQTIKQSEYPNISTALPEYIGTMAAGSGWPPLITVSSKLYSCTPNISKGDSTTDKVEKIINGNKYCISSFVDAAMSHLGGEYTYTRAEGSGTKTGTFSLYWVSCGVYRGTDDSQYDECNDNQTTFFSNLDSLVDKLMQ